MNDGSRRIYGASEEEAIRLATKYAAELGPGWTVMELDGLRAAMEARPDGSTTGLWVARVVRLQ